MHAFILRNSSGNSDNVEVPDGPSEHPPMSGQSIRDRIRGLGWWRFAAGMVAGAAGLGVTFVLRLLGLGVFLPEVAVDFVVGRIPGSVEAIFIQTMGEGAKVLGLATALAIFLILSGAYAMPFRWLQRRVRRRWVLILACATGYAIAVLFVILPILGAGFFGSETSAGAGFATFSQVLAGWTYASVLNYLLVDFAARYPQGFRPSRREFLAGLGILVATVAIAVAGFGSLLASRTARLTYATIASLFAHEETPNEEFYVVTKNVIDPDVDATSWRLTVDGLVEQPRVYSLADLEALATSSEFVTLECISNQVGGNLMSTAEWTGIRLADLIAASTPRPTADWVAFACADGYTVGIPLSRAMAGSTLLALRMKGLPLPRAHGAPARIVVAGLYGMFHAKWVERISLVEGEFLGFWQQKGWSNRGDIRTTAIITTPLPDSVVEGLSEIGGVAFAGARGISRVEVSTDGGTTWSAATLKAPALSESTWVVWTYAWAPPSSGAYRIVARAYDLGGVMQEPARSAPFPNGASGYDAITLLVR